MEDMENLDAMTTEELHAFAAKVRGVRPITVANRLFGKEKGRITAVKDLKNYAWNLITARACRLRGEIKTALMYEKICEDIYRDLPPYARW